MARPTKFRPEFVKVAGSMAKLGATDVEIADAIGVTVRTFYRWSAEDAAFCHATKRGKREADDRVEASLYHRALGYEHEDTDIRVVGTRLVKTLIRKHYPPDTVAAIFWLKNRRPELWRDIKAVEMTGRNGGPVEVVTKDQRDAAVAAALRADK